jgi:hypothetical protein
MQSCAPVSVGITGLQDNGRMPAVSLALVAALCLNGCSVTVQPEPSETAIVVDENDEFTP